MQAWYRGRGAVETRVRFAARCETWMMIGLVMSAINAPAAELDKAMGAIVGGREVPGLT